MRESTINISGFGIVGRREEAYKGYYFYCH